ncbi:hypothetical protein [Desulfobacterium sp. N47]|uniref:Uncharacterized protein n=1 Tax=uncultured Desulfobacterium sp. TaxID=201089 RepID=E1YL40_9BACT|nr:unknown protein [uncultured Desulfobacterium sp.]
MPSILEIELDILVKRFESYSPPLTVDTPLSVDKVSKVSSEIKEGEIDIKTIICPNPGCEMNDKAGEGKI